MSKLEAAYELISDKTKNPVTTTEYIKHGSDWLDTKINQISTSTGTKAEKSYVDTELAKKADKTAVSSLETTVNGKADSSTVSALSTRVGTAETNIATQTARIDAIAALPSGSTSGDAELQDIRVGANGTTYADAGTAVRSQITDVKSDLSHIAVDIVPLSLFTNFTMGMINESTGVLDATNEYACSTASYINIGCDAEIIVTSEYAIKLFRYEKNGTFAGVRKIGGWHNDGENVYISKDYNYKISATPRPSAKITNLEEFSKKIIVSKEISENVGSVSDKFLGVMKNEFSLAYVSGGLVSGIIGKSSGETEAPDYAYHNLGLITPDFMKFDEPVELSFNLANYKLLLFLYDKNKEFIGKTDNDWIENSHTAIILPNTYFKICIARSDSKNITLTREINDCIKFTKKLDVISYEVGWLNNSTGAKDDTNHYGVRSVDLIQYDCPVKVNITEGYQAMVFYYNTNGAFAGKEGYKTGEFVIDANKIFKLCITKLPSEYLIVGTDKYFNLCNAVSVTKMFRIRGNSGNRKKIWWCGTSIPAGYPNPSTVTPYPQLVGDLLGCSVVNVAIPSSSLSGRAPEKVSTANPKGYIATNWESLVKSLDFSREDFHDIIYNYADKITDKPSDFETRKEYYVDYCNEHYGYEGLLLPYLSTGEHGACDIYVFDHFRNDTADLVNKGAYNIDNIKAIDKSNTSRDNIVGSFNHLINLILADNPRAKIIMVGHYSDCDAVSYVSYKAVELQKVITEKLNIPLIETWKYTGMGDRIVGNSTSQKVWSPDGVHPGSDTTGKCNAFLASIISKQIEYLTLD